MVDNISLRFAVLVCFGCPAFLDRISKPYQFADPLRGTVDVKTYNQIPNSCISDSVEIMNDRISLVKLAFFFHLWYIHLILSALPFGLAGPVLPHRAFFCPNTVPEDAD